MARSPYTALYQSRMRTLRVQTSTIAAQQLRAVATSGGSWDAFPEAVAPVVQGAQGAAVGLTAAYLSLVTEQPIPGMPLEDLAPMIRNGVPTSDVYDRVVTTLRVEASKQANFATAIDIAAARASSSADLDVALAARAAFQDVGTTGSLGQAVSGWERVADADACDYCQELDGAHVRSDDAMPIHNNCGCSLEPVDSATWQSWREDRYGTSSSSRYPAESDTANVAAGRILVPGVRVGTAVIREHGELGPVVVAHGQHFTGPADIPAA